MAEIDTDKLVAALMDQKVMTPLLMAFINTTEEMIDRLEKNVDNEENCTKRIETIEKLNFDEIIGEYE